MHLVVTPLTTYRQRIRAIRSGDDPRNRRARHPDPAEAAERAGLISVERYDIAVDLRGLYEGPVWASTSTISFTCTTPGAATFVDCVADISEATLNGAALDPATAVDGRLPLTDLAADNVLVVSITQPETGHSAGILRTVDTSDKLVYVWTSFECDDARRAWACFDQPDLKAPHAFTVTAHDTWTVLSNGAPDGVAESADGDGRTWSFPDTPPLSTYVVVINAGPFHELRRRVDGHDLGLYSRQSTARFLERDADELFDLTEKGLAFFGERFALPFPQERYDQVFVPNMGGAMENWGCVTWTDAVLFRSPPTYAQRGQRAMVLLHEMAHMWFGDLVTMRWWDDLWLNEAFASWASTWAATAVSEFNDAWAGFLITRKLDAYRLDMGPASHPIRGDVPDVSAAMATFDAITYAKGESVLKQLAATIGEDAFVEGLRDYFGKHAWSNTRLSDLMDAFGRAAGRDLGRWTTDWLDRAGTDTISLVDGGRLEVSAPEGTPRPHTLDDRLLLRRRRTPRAVRQPERLHRRHVRDGRAARCRPAPAQRRRPHVRRRTHRCGVEAADVRARRRPPHPDRPGRRAGHRPGHGVQGRAGRHRLRRSRPARARRRALAGHRRAGPRPAARRHRAVGTQRRRWSR